MNIGIRGKKIITLLIIGIILTVGFLMYKEETTNKEVPKKAFFVKNIVKGIKVYD